MSDYISRQAAIEWCRPEDWGTPDERWRPESEYGAMIEALPSAQPERKKGKWIPHSETCREYIGTVLVRVDYDYWFCDACGYRVKNGQPMYKFCPNCGADMRGES